MSRTSRKRAVARRLSAAAGNQREWLSYADRTAEAQAKEIFAAPAENWHHWNGQPLVPGGPVSPALNKKRRPRTFPADKREAAAREAAYERAADREG